MIRIHQMRDFTQYENKQWRLSEALLTPLQHRMVQSTLQLQDWEDVSPNSLTSVEAAAYQHVFPQENKIREP